MKRLIIILALLSSIGVYSQTKTYQVVDAETSAPLPYANVISESMGTITNSEGKFELNLNKINDKLSISYLGYKELQLSKEQLKDTFIFRLKKKTTKLEEVVIYSIDDILSKIIKNLKTNYPINPISEFYFYRVTLLKNNDKGQLSEGYIKVERNKYFDHSNNKVIQISLLTTNKKNNLNDIDFQYLSFQELFNLSESFINLKNGYYNFSYSNVDENFLKISFKPKEQIKPDQIVFNGYLIINKTNYALVEFNYSMASIYKNYIPERIVKSNIYKKDLNTSKFIKWKKNPETNKYILSYMAIKDKLLLRNTKENTKDTYSAIYEFQNVGNINKVHLPEKTQLTKEKRDVFYYDSFNTNSSLWEIKLPLIKNKKQSEFLKKIKQ